MQLFQSSGLQVLHSFLNDSRQHFHWCSSSFPDVLDHLRTTAFASQVAWGYFFPEGMEVFKTAFPKAHLHASRTVSASRSCPFTKAFALHIGSSEEEVCVDDHCLLERWEDGVCCRELNNCCCRSEGKVIYLLLWRWRGGEDWLLLWRWGKGQLLLQWEKGWLLLWRWGCQVETWWLVPHREYGGLNRYAEGWWPIGTTSE